MTHSKRTITTTLALGATALLMTSGAAFAARRVAHHRVAGYVHGRSIAYHRYAPVRQFGYAQGAYYGQPPLDYRNAYPVGAYGTVDETYGYPPGGIVARRTIENQRSPGLTSELDYTTKQTATGGPVGGPLFGGGGR